MKKIFALTLLVAFSAQAARIMDCMTLGNKALHLEYTPGAKQPDKLTIDGIDTMVDYFSFTRSGVNFSLAGSKVVFVENNGSFSQVKSSGELVALKCTMKLSEQAPVKSEF